jgi:hypothetical protein
MHWLTRRRSLGREHSQRFELRGWIAIAPLKPLSVVREQNIVEVCGPLARLSRAPHDGFMRTLPERNS